MSSVREVPCYYLDQDETWMPPCRVVPRDEARRLRNIGLGKFICNGQAFRFHEPTPPLPIDFRPGPLTIGETISIAEIEANVGIAPGEPGTPANRVLVKAAQMKIAAYPHVFDNLAVLARGSWLHSATTISVEG